MIRLIVWLTIICPALTFAEPLVINSTPIQVENVLRLPDLSGYTRAAIESRISQDDSKGIATVATKHMYKV